MATRVATNASRPRLILATCCMSLLLVSLDNLIVNVALPRIGHDLHATVSGLQWTVDAFTLVVSMLLILGGSLADRYGRRRVFTIGLWLFGGGSLLCSLAPSLNLLVAFRALQAIGGSMLNPVAVSIIRQTFEEPRERARAIGVYGATVGLSYVLGPIVGGLLVSSIGWRSIFWVNVPFAALALVLTRVFIPESKADRPRAFDAPGQLLVIVLLGSLTYAIIEGPSLGWLSARELALASAAIVSLVTLIAVELHRSEPLLELHFFRSIPFSGASAIAVIAMASIGGFLFLSTLYLQIARHFSPLEAGIHILPIAVMTLICSPISGRLTARSGGRAPLLLAGAALAGGSAMLVGAGASTSTAWLVIAYGVFGIGCGMVHPPITVTALAGMPAARAGVASAIASPSRQVGITLGVAIVGVIQARDTLHLTSGTVGAAGWWFVAACGLAVMVLGLHSTTRRAQASASVAFSAAELASARS
jgi:EmrB/QacA subfamily drug resistance transporter